MADTKEIISELHDVLIIGGGPAGLAIASRLSEHLPAANFTDEEHQRYHFIRKHGRKMSIKNYKTGAVKQAEVHPTKGIKMLALDGCGDQWMARWDGLFKAFNINHLRSPMFFHIDPAQHDGLLGYTHMEGRGKELREITNCVGKEISKHHRKQSQKQRRQPDAHPNVDERDRNDYFVPSTPLFKSHCDCITDRYSLRNDIVRHEMVLDIHYDYFDEISTTEKVFKIQTKKATHYSRTAVLAVGPGNAPTIPAPFCPQDEAVMHAMQIKDGNFPSPRINEKIAAKQATNVLIVGGGLTSAQISDLAVCKRVKNVWLIMRGELKVKPFDIGLEWVGKFRNFEQAAFWSADTIEERWEKIKVARNGGSVTPPYKKLLDRHIATGKVKLCLHTSICGKQWDDTSKTWHVDLSGPDQSQYEGLPAFDHIYFATGIQSNFETLPYLQTLLAQYPISSCGGIPCITEDMKWRDDVPLFVAGRLGALQLGPGAPNLVGARIGAERIAWSIQDMLEKKDYDSADRGDESFNYATARGSKFDALANLCQEISV